MHSIKIHKVVGSMISLFYKIGIWHHGDKPIVKEMRLKIFYCVYYLFCVLSMLVGAVTNEKIEISIFLSEVSIGTAVLGMKLWFLIWKQHQILNFLDRICVLTIRNEDDYKLFNDKLGRFMRFVIAFLISAAVLGSLDTVILSFLGTGNTLFLEIAFPLDYKNSEFAFWIATIFIFTACLLAIIATLFSVINWYFLLICSLRYEVLGNGLKIMGRRSEARKGWLKEIQMQNDLSEDLEESVNSHIHITELTSELESFLAQIFFVQFGTSGLCICGSIYCLAFNVGDTDLEHVFHLLVFSYFTADIFMITYLGNEIMLSSDRLSYSLFESDWYDQPQSTKKNILIFGEYLKQPKQMLVGKLYPLTLQTFRRILNSAYSMFKILKSFQQ